MFIISIREDNGYIKTLGHVSYVWGSMEDATRFQTREEAQKVIDENKMYYTWSKVKIIKIEGE